MLDGFQRRQVARPRAVRHSSAGVVMAILVGCWLGMAASVAAQLPTTGDRGSPGSTTGGATRGGGCTADAPMAVGLSPDGLKMAQDGEVVLFTTIANPTLYVQVPETTAEMAELIVLDGNGAMLGTQTAPLSGGNTTISMALFSDGGTLAVGETYRWALSLVCDPGDRSSDRVILGTIELGTMEHPSQDAATPPTPSNLPNSNPTNPQLLPPRR